MLARFQYRRGRVDISARWILRIVSSGVADGSHESEGPASEYVSDVVWQEASSSEYVSDVAWQEESSSEHVSDVVL